MYFEVALVVKNLPASAGDISDAVSIPGWGRSLGRGQDTSPQYSCLENPMDRGTWQAIVHRIAQSRTWLKQLSMPTWKDRFFFLFYSSGPDLNSIKWWGECHCTFLRQCLPFSQWSFPLIQAWYLCQLVLGTIMLCNKQSSNSEFSKIGLHSPIHGRRQWHPTPVLLPGKSHGQRSLVGCSPWGH